jgi:sugar transferase EpsL
MLFVLFPAGMPRSKRLLDLLITIPGLVILSPVFFLVSIAVLGSFGWPIFFLQSRPGYHGRIFRLIKFRTMRLADVKASPENDAQRLTGFGRFLRATSLDEIPELINVLSGEMSIVGPRPLLVQYLDRYTPEQARRHEVLPGITGWAQVNGRNILSWEDKFKHDVWYVDHWSFELDLRILLLSIGKVIKQEGINQSGSATAEEFKGK